MGLARLPEFVRTDGEPARAARAGRDDLVATVEVLMMVNEEGA